MWSEFKSRASTPCGGGVSHCTGQKNGFAQICSLQTCRKNVRPRSKYGANMVNTTFAYQTTGSVNIKANGVFAVYVTDLLLSFFTLRRMCQKQICSNPFFRPVFCVERFFPGYSGFPLSRLKTNISRLHSARNGRRRTIMWMCYL